MVLAKNVKFFDGKHANLLVQVSASDLRLMF